MPILDAIHEISGVSDFMVSIGAGVVRRGGVIMDNLEAVQEYASKMKYALNEIIDEEWESSKPNRTLIEFLTVQKDAFSQMLEFTEWLELKENAPETRVSHGAIKK